MNTQDLTRRRPKVTLTLARETLEWLDARATRLVSRGEVVDVLVEIAKASVATKSAEVPR
jgi:hypothetical protein